MHETRTDVHVGGDVRGNLIVGDNNVVVTAEHSVVTVNRAGERPRPVRRAHVELLPRRSVTPHGRDHEITEIMTAVAAAEAIQLHGVEGMGKSTVVRHTARRLAVQGSGVVFLNGSDRDGADLAQDVFEACYDTQGYRPSPVELRRLMAGVDVNVVIDDLICTGGELSALLDAVPDAGFVVASTTQSLWGAGRLLPLHGLGREDSRTVLADALGRPLRAAEADAADALWEAVQGSPLALHRAAAFTRTGADGLLPRPGQVPDLMPQVLDRLTGTERALVATMAAAGTPVSERLLAFLLETDGGVGAAVERLASYGVATLSELGCGLTAGVTAALPETLAPAPDALAAITDRLTEWVATPDATPRAVAEHARLIAAVTKAAASTGRADAGARLAAAAAPAAACSLRWTPWRRILREGKAAAEATKDGRLIAYFTHEQGVLSLLTGKKALAAVGLAAAAELYLKLGHHGHAAVAQHAHALAGHVSSSAHAASAHAAGQAAGHATTQVVTNTATHVAGHGAGHAGLAGTTKATATKTGLTLTGKLALGGGLTAVVAGGTVVGVKAMGTETVPVHVRVLSSVIGVKMPGDPESGCVRTSGTTNCTTVVKVKKGREGPVSVNPNGPLPAGTGFSYWGCLQKAPATSCTVRADADRRVCITTSDARDEADETACARWLGLPLPTKPLGLGRFTIAAPTTWKVVAKPAADNPRTVVRVPGTCAKDKVKNPAQFGECAGFQVLTGVLSGPFGLPFRGDDSWAGQYAQDEGYNCPQAPEQRAVGRENGARLLSSGTKSVGGRSAIYREWWIPCHARFNIYTDPYGIGRATGVTYTERTWYFPQEKLTILDEWSTPGLADILAKAQWK